MKRYAVSSTFHMIDERGLDGTSLEIIEAKNPKAAATQVVMRNLLELDEDFYEDYYECNKIYLYPTKNKYLKHREAYWKKNIKFDTKEAKELGYTFIFDSPAGIYGIKVIEI